MEKEANSENIWQNKEKAEEILKNKSELEYTLNKLNYFKSKIEDILLFYDLAKEENNQENNVEFINICTSAQWPLQGKPS